MEVLNIFQFEPCTIPTFKKSGRNRGNIACNMYALHTYTPLLENTYWNKQRIVADVQR